MSESPVPESRVPESGPVRLTRRRALAGAAWSAPAIVVASAVPSFAASPSTSLNLRPGGTYVERAGGDPDEFYDLAFSGLSVVVPVALAAGQLTLTVTYTPLTSGGPNGLFVQGAPVGWTASPTVGAMGAPVVTLTYGSPVLAGTEVQVESGIHVGAELPRPTQVGTYQVTAAAPGLTSSGASFATPNAREAARMRVVPRPRT